jgi:hypothetical protein
VDGFERASRRMLDTAGRERRGLDGVRARLRRGTTASSGFGPQRRRHRRTPATVWASGRERGFERPFYRLERGGRGAPRRERDGRDASRPLMASVQWREK